MRYVIHRVICYFLTIYFVIPSLGQNKQGTSFYIKIKNYDLSKVFLPDSIIDDANERYKRPEPVGYIDPNYQKNQIHLATISKSKSDPYVYQITGKTKVKENICSFKGTITVVAAEYDSSSLMIDLGFPQYRQGLITGQLYIEEDKTQAGSGIIKGKISTDIYFDSKDKIHYNALMLIADGFYNNQVEANWISYKTGETKRCNWGNFRIPDSRELDFCTGEFSVNPKYKQNGWTDFNYGYNEMEWWKEK
ncbi:MAG: hypothetical protein NVV82_13105 [Sporocytophaga sp.]|nr:hypothetical protein [Sporocytophaga sp.]